MPNKTSQEHFERLLVTRLNDVQNRMNDLKNVIAATEPNGRINAVKNALSALYSLQLLLTPGDYPNWMEPMRQRLSAYETHPGNVPIFRQLVEEIIRRDRDIQLHIWDFSDTQTATVDFTAFAAEAIAESRLDELFKQLIAQLETLAEHPDFDSRAAASELQRIIDALKKNSTGDMTARMAAARIAKFWVQRSLRKFAEDTPGISHVAQPIYETLDQMAPEFRVIKDKFNNKLNKFVYDVGVDIFDFVPDLSNGQTLLDTDVKPQNLLPAPADSSQPDSEESRR